MTNILLIYCRNVIAMS